MSTSNLMFDLKIYLYSNADTNVNMLVSYAGHWYFIKFDYPGPFK